MGEALAAGTPGVQVVQAIGRVVVLYRPNPDRPATPEAGEQARKEQGKSKREKGKG